MENRKYIVELWRFIGAIAIMMFHLQQVFDNDYPFLYAWIYVEFFFILTGYLTVAHFAGRKESVSTEKRACTAEAIKADGRKDKLPEQDVQGQDSCTMRQFAGTGGAAHTAVSYTIHKMMGYFPYIFLSVTAIYIIEVMANGIGGERAFVSLVENYLCEILLLTSSGLASAKLATLWYLSALFLMLPVFIYLLLNSKTREVFLYIGSWLVPAVYYGCFGANARLGWPHDMARAFSCLCLGALVYMLCGVVKGCVLTSMQKAVFTLIEEGSLLLALVLAWFNSTSYILMIMLFVVGLTLIFSGKTLTAQIGRCARRSKDGQPGVSFCGKVLSYLGKLSLPLYLFHWVTRAWMINWCSGWPEWERIIVFYAVTLAAAVLAGFIADRCKPIPVLPKADSPEAGSGEKE